MRIFCFMMGICLISSVYSVVPEKLAVDTQKTPLSPQSPSTVVKNKSGVENKLTNIKIANASLNLATILEGKVITIDDPNKDIMKFGKVAENGQSAEIFFDLGNAKLNGENTNSSDIIDHEWGRRFRFTVNVSITQDENGEYHISYAGKENDTINGVYAPADKKRFGLSLIKINEISIKNFMLNFSFHINKNKDGCYFFVNHTVETKATSLMARRFLTGEDGISLGCDNNKTEPLPQNNS